MEERETPRQVEHDGDDGAADSGQQQPTGPGELARQISATVEVPVIGIGAGPDCDGQVLVSCDMLGLTSGFEPKFLKRFADLKTAVIAAAGQYVQEVASGEFPSNQHSHD